MNWESGVKKCKLLHRMDRQEVLLYRKRDLYPISWERPGWKIIVKKRMYIYV